MCVCVSHKLQMCDHDFLIQEQSERFNQLYCHKILFNSSVVELQKVSFLSLNGEIYIVNLPTQAATGGAIK